MQIAQHGILGNQLFNPVLAPSVVTSRATIFTVTDGGHDWMGRPDVTKLPNGVIIALWTEATAHNDLADRIWNINFSDDDGATWTANNVYLDAGAVTGFPMVANAPDATGIGSMQLISCLNGDLIIISAERVNVGTPGYENGWVTLYLYRSTDNGKTWDGGYDLGAALPDVADETKIWASYTHTKSPSGVIYIPISETTTDVNGNTRQRVYRSGDHGVTWTHLSNFVEYSEMSPTGWELGIAWMPGGRMIGIVESSAYTRTFMKISEDEGETWGSIVEITEEMGYVGVHQPKVERFNDFLILTGRYVSRAPEFVCRNGYWISTDDGTTWTRRYLDSFNIGLGGTGLDAGDAGYVKFFLRDDRTFFFFGYYGDNGAAVLYQYQVESGTPTPEDYSNVAYLPETFDTDYIRMSMSRDWVAKALSALPITGEASIYRVHNTLNTTYGFVFVSTQGTNNPEFIVDSGKGWLIFNSSVITTGNIGNTIFRSSFSGTIWLLPDDGQPTTSGVIAYNSSSTNPATVGSRFQLSLTTAGKIQILYSIGGTTVTARINDVIFADGVITIPVLVVFTFTSGGLIRIYIGNTLQTLEAGALGDISALTMASYTANTPLFVGSRQNGAGFDLPYAGKARELIFQPGVYSTTDIDNLLLN